MDKITDGAQMAKLLADFANGALCDDQGFAEEITLRTHRTLQQSLMSLFLKTIKAWSEMETWDKRNEATIQLAKKMAEIFPNEVKYGLPFI